MNNEAKINELRTTKNELLKQVEVKNQFFKQKFGSIPIEMPILWEEREAKAEINKIYSEINQLVRQIRTLAK